MGMFSRQKGKRGERAWARFLRDNFGCADARRGVQHAGGPGSPDVRDGIPGTHAEVKRCETLSLYSAMQQAKDDAGESVPYVAHRRNGQEWLVVVRASDLAEFAAQVYLQLASEGQP